MGTNSPVTSHFFTPRGTSCTSCLSRRDRYHSVRLSPQHAPALAPPLARPPFEPASLSAGVPAAFPAPAQNPATSAPEAVLPPSQPHWPQLPRRPPSPPLVAPASAAPADAAPLPAHSARDTDIGSFRCRSAPSCLRTE